MWGQPQNTPTKDPEPSQASLESKPTPKATHTETPVAEYTETSTDLPTMTPAGTSVPSPTPTIPESAINTLIFTGSIIPGRCVQDAVDQRGEADYIYDDVRTLLQEADLTVGTLNAALSDYPPVPDVWRLLTLWVAP